MLTLVIFSSTLGELVMAKITLNDLNRRYTEIVSSYVSKGYFISPTTHGGKYTGERCHIDLMYPYRSVLVRIWLLEGYPDGHSAWGYDNTLIISVRAYNLDCNKTYWPNEGIVLSETVFYEIDRDKCYTSSIEEVSLCRSLREKRRKNKYYTRYNTFKIDLAKVSKTCTSLILNKINLQKGFKKAKVDSITGISLFKSCSNRLMATISYDYNGKSGTLTLR